MNACTVCGKLVSRKSAVYCSNKCQRDLEYTQYVDSWKKGEVSGSRGIATMNFSAHLRRYFLEQNGSACSLCGWDKIHPITGTVPLEIDHIDGNSSNNTPDNLRVICPNCHSLTSNFKNLNKGNGRGWRRAKYNKNT